jgi:hypothetical protein
MESEQPVRRAERPEPVSAVCIRRACLFKAKPKRFKSRTTPSASRVGVLQPLALNVACKAATGVHAVLGGQNGWKVEYVNRGDLGSIERVGLAPMALGVMTASFQESEPA